MPPVHPDCALSPGCVVLTLEGALPIEALYPGDQIITRDAGAQPLVDIQRHALPDEIRQDDRDILFVAKDALDGRPDCNMLLPESQHIYLRDWRAQAHCGTPAARVAMRRLIDGEYIKPSKTRPKALISLHFAYPHIIYADGLELFSADPLPVSA